MRMRPLIAALIPALAGMALFVPAMAQSPTLPPYTPAYAPKSGDERDLWMFSAQFERELAQSPHLLRDQPLNDYVRRVLCETVGADRCGAVRIYVLDQPIVNAGMAANGAMTVWTGLLLRTRSEAELGAVLGHEFAHFELRHGLGGMKEVRATMASRETDDGSGKGGSAKQQREKERALLKSYFRYNRAQEAAADELGLKYLAASRYPSAAAAWNWQHQIEEADAVAAARAAAGGSSPTAPAEDGEEGFYDTHPSDRQRSARLTELAAQYDDGNEDPGIAAHYQALKPHMARLLDGLVQQNEFGATEYLLKVLAAHKGWDAELLYARAEMHRMRGADDDFASAAQYYREAMAQGLNRPDVYRDLGVSLARAGRKAEARVELATYLQLVPNAADGREMRALMDP
ncbi:M48 family metalloprotease [Altererythrobacter xixiisoli]|uniref:M48 family metalloprotease n=1 Tax=Croceibacterium xixiisoli TaxID=1476466 RepID=A0A6I4TVE3_9SPHN|nr:M48 family metallopeptidase [Croceibacterium xixiisoli]MXO99161.1 M48 family metalloprotease [Croceibacterium xixiisoli]